MQIGQHGHIVALGRQYHHQAIGILKERAISTEKEKSRIMAIHGPTAKGMAILFDLGIELYRVIEKARAETEIATLNEEIDYHQRTLT
jgi:hypothetical protein